MTTRELILMLAETIGVIAVMMLVRLSPRMNPPALGFKYPRREAVVSLSLYILILGFAFLFYSSSVNTALSASSTPFDRVQQRLLVAAFSLAAFGVALFTRRQPMRSMGWPQAMLSPSLRLALAFVFLTLFLQGKILLLFNGISTRQAQALGMLVLLCMAEETAFRGFIQPRLISWLGDTNGWLITALLFTLWQAPRLMLDPATLPLNLVITAIQGVLLGWIARQSGHILAPAIFRAVSEWARMLSMF